MVRKMALIMACLAVFLPGWVHALGLGDIELHSYLNQPLDADIEILSSVPGETDGLKVGLASADEFERAGLEFTQALRGLKFEVMTKSNGKQFIKISSQNNYREPFLSILLEVNWARGRILREYSVLVDPPNLVEATPSAVQAPAAAPRQTTTMSSAESAAENQRYPRIPASAPSQPANTGIIGDSYTTQRNDTAWKIATRVRPDESVTVEQAMIALLQANPQAFMGKNINRLKAGYVLGIPDRDAMMSISQSDAVAEVRKQTREWRNRSTMTAGAATSPEGRLEILPPKDTAAAESSQATGAKIAGDTAELHRDAMLAREAAEAQRQENSELRTRISELEEQVKNTNRLASLKDDQLAALQKKLKELQDQKAAEAAAAATAPAAATAEPAAEQPAQPEEATAAATAEPAAEEPAAATEEQAKKEIVEAKPAAPGTPVNNQVVSGFEPVDLDKLPKSELPAKPFKDVEAPAATAPVAVVPPAEKAEPESIVDTVKGYFETQPMMAWLVVGAIGLIVLLLIVKMVLRGRSSDDFEESILQEKAVDASAAGVAGAGYLSGKEEAEEEPYVETIDAEESPVAEKAESPAEKISPDTSSFMSDLVISDLSDLQGEGAESDPLTEADVFLAYGRFGPAENMIKDAIAKEPERNDLKLKLLEIYYSAKNRDAFESEARNFKTYLEAQPDQSTWDKVVEMAEDLCPDSDLLGSASAASMSGNEGVEDISFEGLESELEQDADTHHASAGEETTTVLDFDLGEFESQLESMEAESSELSNEKPSEDFGLDLDLSKLSEEGGQADRDKDVTAELTSELEEIASTLDEDTQSISEGGTVTGLENTQELDAPDLVSELGLDEMPEAEAPLDDEEFGMDDDALADIDEVGTKLDLARAYIDMGDPDGARSILDEVLEEGNDDQKKEAQELLDKI